MPTYEYQCMKCGHLFEVFQSISDKPINKCTICQGSVKRLISSGGGLIFKGSGFYITDYKLNQKKPSEEKKQSSEEKKSEGDSVKKYNKGEKKDSK